MYPPGSEYASSRARPRDRWEGAARPGHFAGVLTVVAKLFHLVEPDVAVLRAEGRAAGGAGPPDGARPRLAARDRRRADGARARRPRAQQPQRLPRRATSGRRRAGPERGACARPTRRCAAGERSAAALLEAYARGARHRSGRGDRVYCRRRADATGAGGDGGRRHRRRARRPGRPDAADRQHHPGEGLGRDESAIRGCPRPGREVGRRAAGAHRARGSARRAAGRIGCGSRPRTRSLAPAPPGCTTRFATPRRRARALGAGRAPGPAELRHGPASAARAAAEGETDRGVLDAVRYHSVGLGGVGHGRPGALLRGLPRAGPRLRARAAGRARRALPRRSRRRAARGRRATGWPTSSAQAGPSPSPRCASGTASSHPPARADRRAGAWRSPARWRCCSPPEREHVAGHAYAIPSPGRRIRVEVLNGTRRPGSARLATRRAAAAGPRRGVLRTGPAADIARGSSCGGAIRGRDGTWPRRSAPGGWWSSPTRSAGWT